MSAFIMAQKQSLVEDFLEEEAAECDASKNTRIELARPTNS